MSWWMVAGAVVSAYGSIQAGKAKRAEAQARKAQLLEQKKDAEVVSMQEHNIRMANLNLGLGINDAIAGVMGRDMGSDRSLKAIKNKMKSEADTTENRARLQYLSEQSQRSMGMQIEDMRGKNAMRAARISAVSSLLSAGNQYSQISSGPSASPTMRQVGYGSRSYST
tara:strand:- start:734 stop:1237 length:504 start_codon:yes stop_codon:yes gene_type:complete